MRREELGDSPFYTEPTAPIGLSDRSWLTIDVAVIWMSMAICVPSYLLMGRMVEDGLDHFQALVLIFAANLLLVPLLVLNGQPGVRYGVPFLVVARSAFGLKGARVVGWLRALVGCIWFSLQSWIGAGALYAVVMRLFDVLPEPGFNLVRFVCFLLFMVLHVLLFWPGLEFFKWPARFVVPIMLVLTAFLVSWSMNRVGGIQPILNHAAQFQEQTAELTRSLNGRLHLALKPLKDERGRVKADSFRVSLAGEPFQDRWIPLNRGVLRFDLSSDPRFSQLDYGDHTRLWLQFRAGDILSSVTLTEMRAPMTAAEKTSRLVAWLAVLLGFWAAMTVNISDFTRFVSSQRRQFLGQLLGLPLVMAGVACCALIFTVTVMLVDPHVIITADAPWDPFLALRNLESDTVFYLGQLLILLATMSTNIPANLVPSAAGLANSAPRKIGQRGGALLSLVIAIGLGPWWFEESLPVLVTLAGGFLGPVLGVLLADYFWYRGSYLQLSECYKPHGAFHYFKGYNPMAMIAVVLSFLIILPGYLGLAPSWWFDGAVFTGGIPAFLIYGISTAWLKRKGRVGA